MELKKLTDCFNQNINNLTHLQPNLKKNIYAYKNINNKVNNYQVRLNYLYSHKNNNVIPNHLEQIDKKIYYTLDNNYFNEHEMPNFLKSFSSKLLNLQIKITHWKLYKLKKDLEKELNNIKIINCDLAKNLEELCTKYSLDFCKMKNNLLNKKTILRNTKNNGTSYNYPNPRSYFNNNLIKYNELYLNNWCINLSNTHIPQNIMNFLSLGHNFNLNIDTNNNDIKNIIVDLEYALKLSDSQFNLYYMRNTINNLLTNYINKNKHKINKSIDPLEKQINNDALSTKIFLKNNTHLIITKADKCNKTVILTNEQYLEKMNSHLDDKTTYIKIRKTPDDKKNEIKKEYNKLISELHKKNYINNTEKTKLNINNCTIARINGLPKIHKKNTPIRPIINAINSPTEKIAEFINPSLNFLNNNNPYDIKNSSELIEKLKNISLNKDDRLISLDIISLFTNIPLNELYRLILKKWSLIEPYTNIKCKNTYLNIIKFICSNNYFTFNNILYRQVNGVPMGGKMSTNLSGILVNNLLDDFLQKNLITPKFTCKYVDDILMIINKEDCDKILNEVNKMNKNIQFTLELEKNMQINYLDLTIIRNNNKVTTKWFEKDIKDKQILNYLSNHPKSQKINTVRNLINRAIKLTNHEHIKEIKKYIFNKLQINLYPHKLIKDIWNSSYYNNMNINKKENNNTNNNTKYVSLTYIKDLTESINTVFKKENINDIRFGNKPNHKIKKIYHTNTYDKIKKFEQTNIVYKINCNDCDKVYIGETKQNLSQRLKQHDYDIRTKKENTAIAEHCKNENHKIDLNNITIIDKEKNTTKRKLLEAFHISKNKRSINYKTDSLELNKFYANIKI